MRACGEEHAFVKMDWICDWFPTLYDILYMQRVPVKMASLIKVRVVKTKLVLRHLGTLLPELGVPLSAANIDADQSLVHRIVVRFV